MTFLEKFESFNKKISLSIEWVGVAALFLMMIITTVDVIGAKLFLMPLFGALDVMAIAQLLAMSFAVSTALILGRHVQVEFFVMLLPERAAAFVDCVVNFLGIFLFALIVWRLFVFGYELKVDGEVSSTARIPFYPFVYGAAFACIPVCLVYIYMFIDSIRKVIKK
ncbi:TRAP transporter small permease [Desulfobacula sp.]|uniref:TRAP transporter small permease n=1 Tax=Desulfobacula sp. TaxID=2593537 RepID=UPI00262F9885|nr:TRAP transporter small permease [Desulfobacula sp.]